MATWDSNDLKAWRKLMGWTQAEVAERLGVSVRAVKHYEGGTRRISPMVAKLCAAIGRRGNYGIAGRSRSDIATPPRACRWLYETISAHYKISRVLDPCAGDGRLLRPWRAAGCEVEWYEIKRGKDFFLVDELEGVADLVVCNPPFNGVTYKKWRLGSEAFLHKIFELTWHEQKIALFAPIGFRTNVARGSARARALRDWNITSNVALPRNFFGEDVAVHSEILLFNMPRLRTHAIVE